LIFAKNLYLAFSPRLIASVSICYPYQLRL
jgi:hypothetical protein